MGVSNSPVVPKNAPRRGMAGSPRRFLDYGERFSALAAYPAAFLVVAFVLVPLLIMIKVSLSGPEDIFTQHPPFLIHHLTLDHWRDVIAAGGICRRSDGAWWWPPARPCWRCSWRRRERT